MKRAVATYKHRAVYVFPIYKGADSSLLIEVVILRFCTMQPPRSLPCSRPGLGSACQDTSWSCCFPSP